MHASAGLAVGVSPQDALADHPLRLTRRSAHPTFFFSPFGFRAKYSCFLHLQRLHSSECATGFLRSGDVQPQRHAGDVLLARHSARDQVVVRLQGRVLRVIRRARRGAVLRRGLVARDPEPCHADADLDGDCGARVELSDGGEPAALGVLGLLAELPLLGAAVRRARQVLRPLARARTPAQTRLLFHCLHNRRQPRCRAGFAISCWRLRACSVWYLCPQYAKSPRPDGLWNPWRTIGTFPPPPHKLWAREKLCSALLVFSPQHRRRSSRTRRLSGRSTTTTMAGITSPSECDNKRRLVLLRVLFIHQSEAGAAV